MNVELINTGTELLLGHVTNTHLPWLAQSLFGLGIRVARQVTVPDGEPIRQAVVEARDRPEDSIVIITGGLGPTSDDVTREVVAGLLGRQLIFHADIRDKIISRFVQRQLTPPQSVEVQAMVPEGALVLSNDHGTAPGLLLEEARKVYILLPGPPRELKPMWTQSVLPWLRANRLAVPLYERIWRIVGMGESAVQELCEARILALGAMEIGYCARPGEVDFRLISTDRGLLDRAAKIVEELVGHAITGTGEQSLEEAVIQLATQKKLKISTTESCTGGLIAHRLTNVPGSSQVFGFGWVTYANEAKQQELGVSQTILDQYGAVSEECVLAMAEGARAQSGADLAVAVTGIAGPSGGSPDKPVGTCWFGLSDRSKTVSLKKQLSTDRESFKSMASQIALDLLRRRLIELP